MRWTTFHFSILLLFTFTARSLAQSGDAVPIASLDPALEREKLNLEWLKLWVSGGAIAGPLLIATIGFWTAVTNQRNQEKLQRAAKEAEAKIQFELKAAEIVMAEHSPYAAHGKARALKTLFPERLSAGFADSFRPENFLDTGSESPQAKSFFFERAIANQAALPKMLELWKKLFPEHIWVNRVEELLSDRKPDKDQA
jgi:hypothetical protein